MLANGLVGETVVDLLPKRWAWRRGYLLASKDSVRV